MSRYAVIALVLFLTVSCARPSSYETFILKEKAQYGDTYSFNLDFHDSLSTYNLDLYTRMERKAFGRFSADSLDLRVNWVSPEDSILTEDLVLRLGAATDSSYFSKDYILPLKEGFAVPAHGSPGIWRLRVLIKNNPEDIRGLGVVFSREGN